MNYQYQYPFYLGSSYTDIYLCCLQGFCFLLTVYAAIWLMNVALLLETRPSIGRREHKGPVSMVVRLIFLVNLLQGLACLAFPSTIVSFLVRMNSKFSDYEDVLHNTYFCSCVNLFLNCELRYYELSITVESLETLSAQCLGLVPSTYKLSPRQIV